MVLANVPNDWITFHDVGRFADYRRRVGEVVVRVPKDAERDFIIASAVLPDGSLLQVGHSTDSRQALLNPVKRDFVIVGAITVIVSFLLGAFFVHRTLLPIRQIVATARSIINTRQLDARVPAGKSDDELAELVRLFNTLLDQNQSHPRHARIP